MNENAIIEKQNRRVNVHHSFIKQKELKKNYYYFGIRLELVLLTVCILLFMVFAQMYRTEEIIINKMLRQQQDDLSLRKYHFLNHDQKQKSRFKKVDLSLKFKKADERVQLEEWQDKTLSPTNNAVATVVKRKSDGVRTTTARTIKKTTILVAVNNNDNGNNNDDVDYQSIIEKWQMPIAAIPDLKKIRSRPVGFDYNQTSDILSLQHPHKSGGTSFSLMLKEIFKERVLPGSGKSHFFQEEEFEKALQEHPPGRDKGEGEEYWNQIGAFYTHSLLRPTLDSPNADNLLDMLRKQAPMLAEKRFRLMTIIRKPIDQAASNFYESICRIAVYSGEYFKVIKNVTECPVTNLTDIKLQMMKEKQECLAGTRKDSCNWLEDKHQNFFDTCGSIDKFLESTLYHNHNYKTLMGKLPAPPPKPGSETPTLNDVALYTIRDLGGLVDFNGESKEDFIWFAITERMEESMCLFFYRFKINPVEQRHDRYKKCRPINIWTEKQKRQFEENEIFDYTVWRASNAVLDVRMEDMRLEIKGKLDAGAKIDEIHYLGSGCYIDTNSKQI